MSNFIKAAVADMNGGRETWRVRVTLALPAFMIALAVAAIHVR